MTVKRSLNELETAGLIMRVRQGVGEPNSIPCPSFQSLVDGVAFFYLILGRKKAGDLFQISCSVCRCVSGGYLVVKVWDKLTRCVGGKLELISFL